MENLKRKLKKEQNNENRKKRENRKKSEIKTHNYRKRKRKIKKNIKNGQTKRIEFIMTEKIKSKPLQPKGNESITASHEL